jgi:hypothetical protein
MKTRAPKAISFSTLFLLLAGCSNLTSNQSGDALKAIYANRVAQVRAKYEAPNLQDPLNILVRAQIDPKARNEVLNDYIFLIDTNYNFWEKKTYEKKAFADFGSDFSAATLSTLSAVVTGGGVQGAKSILSLISAGITSTKASFNQDVLQNQSLIAMLATIRASRVKKLVALQSGMYKKNDTTSTLSDRPIAEYSLPQGLVDLAAYYQAGTFIGGFQDMIDKAGADKTAAQATIDQKVKNIPSVDDGLGVSTPDKKKDE